MLNDRIIVVVHERVKEGLGRARGMVELEVRESERKEARRGEIMVRIEAWVWEAIVVVVVSWTRRKLLIAVMLEIF